MAIMPMQSFAATKENVDESKVPPYVLPDPLIAVRSPPRHIRAGRRRPQAAQRMS